MPRVFSRIREELLYSTVVCSGKDRVRKQINEDNRKVAVIWSAVEIAFWVLCLALSVNDEIFTRCRPLYITAVVLSAATMVLAAFVAPRLPSLIRPLIIVMQLVLLSAGIGLAFFQWDVRSATFIAAVLIVPVMFLTDTLPTTVCVALCVVAFMILGPQYIEPDVYNWTYKTLIIFSIAGILIGHIINKTRFERYAFAESALGLAELQNRYAYYDQLTGLQNRRAYSEKVEQLELGMPATCCVISADINGLKLTNDTYGHSAGDELIMGAAACLSTSFEDVGEVYRLGGDEFCVIALESFDVEEHLRQMEQMAADWKGQIVEGVSISYGVATAQDGPDIDAVLRVADQKMYEYKRNYYTVAGRDRRHRSNDPSTDQADSAMGFAG